MSGARYRLQGTADGTICSLRYKGMHCEDHLVFPTAFTSHLPFPPAYHWLLPMCNLGLSFEDTSTESYELNPLFLHHPFS